MISINRDVRQSLADLALDTVVFNGHTTCADTLWAAVPIVTLPGEQMRSEPLGFHGKSRRRSACVLWLQGCLCASRVGFDLRLVRQVTGRSEHVARAWDQQDGSADAEGL